MANRRPPLPCRPLVADIAGAKHLQGVSLPILGHLCQVGPESGAPNALQSPPVGRLQQQRLTNGRQLFSCRHGSFAGRDIPHQFGQFGIIGKQPVKLVPLDLVGHDGRDQVIEVRRRGDVRRQHLDPVVVPSPPAAGRLHRGPLVHPQETGSLKRPRRLPQHNPAHIDDAGRQALRRIHEGVHVRRRLGRPRVQGRCRRQVGRLQAGDADRARALQQRGVRPNVEIDFPFARAGASGRAPAPHQSGNRRCAGRTEPIVPRSGLIHPVPALSALLWIATANRLHLKYRDDLHCPTLRPSQEMAYAPNYA